MSELQRVIKVIDWLIFNKVVKNRKDLAIKLDYTESSLSQIINEKVSLSDKFIKNLSEIDKRINKDWIKTGNGQMIVESKATEQNINSELRIQKLESDLAEKDKTINKLLALQQDLVNIIMATSQAKNNNNEQK